jgi:hypothetical protein
MARKKTKIRGTSSSRRPRHPAGELPEELPGTYAVRFREGREAAVRQAVGEQGDVQSIPNQNLLIVSFSDPDRQRVGLESLHHLQDRGAVEFVTPVLLNPSSQLRQILTDEITVRFKQPGPPPERLQSEYGLTVARRNEFVPNQYVLRLERPRGLKTLEVAKALDQADDVEFAAPNYISEHRRS